MLTLDIERSPQRGRSSPGGASPHGWRSSAGGACESTRWKVKHRRCEST